MVTNNHPFEGIYSRFDVIENILRDLAAKQTAKEDFAEYPEFLSRKQAAQMVGVGLSAIDRYSNEGTLKKHRNGKLVRFKKSEVIQAFKTFEKWQRL